MMDALRDLLLGYGHGAVFSSRVDGALLSQLVLSRLTQAVVFQSLAFAIVWRQMRRTISFPAVVVWSCAAFFELEALVDAVQLWVLFIPAFVLRNDINIAAGVVGLFAAAVAFVTPFPDLTRWWRHQCRGMLSTINLYREAAGKPPVEMPAPPGLEGGP